MPLQAEPPEMARGRIARTYIYMEAAYKRYSMSKSQRQLMSAWDKMYPVDSWECTRAKKITSLQKSQNDIIKNDVKLRVFGNSTYRFRKLMWQL